MLVFEGTKNTRTSTKTYLFHKKKKKAFIHGLQTQVKKANLFHKATNAGKEIKVQADKEMLNERIRQKTTHAFAI